MELRLKWHAAMYAVNNNDNNNNADHEEDANAMLSDVFCG
jgi:hypothetical protein